MAELIDIVDENGEPTGKHVDIMYAHLHGVRHRAVHLWLYTKNGEVVLQQRSEDRRHNPGLWDVSCAGHNEAGEEPTEAAVRICEEELGITIPEDQLHFVCTFEATDSRPRRHFKNNELHYVYLAQMPQDFSAQDDEVKTVGTFSIQEFQDMVTAHPEKFVPRKDYWQKMIDTIKEAVK